MLVTVNNRLKFEIEIVHDLSCHPIFLLRDTSKARMDMYKAEPKPTDPNNKVMIRLTVRRSAVWEIRATKFAW